MAIPVIAYLLNQLCWPALQGGTDEEETFPNDSFASLKLLILFGFMFLPNAALSSNRDRPIGRSKSADVDTLHQDPFERRFKPDISSSKTTAVVLPPYNAAALLGSAYPWRCCRQKRKKNPSHYHLIKKVLRRRGTLGMSSRRQKKRRKPKKKPRDTSRDVPPH